MSTTERKLQLAWAEGMQKGPQSGPRPFRTFYFGPRSRETEWSHRGSAKTREGAVRAAFWQLVCRRAQSAVVHDEDGVVVARLRRNGKSISVVGI